MQNMRGKEIIVGMMNQTIHVGIQTDGVPYHQDRVTDQKIVMVNVKRVIGEYVSGILSTLLGFPMITLGHGALAPVCATHSVAIASRVKDATAMLH